MSITSSLRYTLRQFKNSPGFFAIAVAALALGIGANSAIFSAVQAVLLKPLPYADPSRLVMVWEDAAFIGFAHNTPAPANYVDWRKQNQVFTDMLALRYETASITGDGIPEQVVGGAVTPNFFNILGVQPGVGRPWTAEEDAKSTKAVLLSHGLWQRRYGGDPAIAGREILMNGQKTLVVGVMPRGFYFPDRQIEYWIPASFTPEVLSRRESHYLNVVARLKPGVTLEQARRDMQVLAKRLADAYPDSNSNLGAVVIPLQEDLVGDARIGLWALQIGSVFVLLIACSNLANLLLVRASGRRREIAVRIALGATKRQIIGQLVTEGLLLSVAGGALGLWVGDVCWQLFGRLIPAQMAGASFQTDWRVVLFTLGISLAAGVFFSLVPAWQATHISLHDSLKEGARAGESRGGIRLRDALVVGQFALAFALLVGAGLMIETLWNLRQIRLGFRSDHLVTMGVPLPRAKYDADPKRRNFYRGVLGRLQSAPGVVSAGFASQAPFTTEGDTEGYLIEGASPLRPGQINDTLYREVTPGYLSAIGATLLEGRLLNEEDGETTMPVVVISEFMAKTEYPGKSAVGKRIQVGGTGEPWRTVVGVVADIRERGLILGMKPAVYLSTEQVKRPSADFLVVRTVQDTASIAGAARSAVQAVDPDQPVALVRTMEQLIETNVADRKRPMVLLGVFAGLALLLACIGVYGVLAYSVAQRTREIGVRMALGARPLEVTRMIVGRGLKLSLVGLAAGAGLAFALGRLLQTLLYGVAPAAPAVYASTAVVLLLVALLACAIPAQRAARVNPVVALHDE